METELISTTIDRNRIFLDALAGFRGSIVDARIAYPEVLHLDVQDEAGKLWQFATQDASWSPSDPDALRGKSILGADVNWDTGDLQCELTGGIAFTVIPAPQEAPDDPPNWELFMPDGQLLDFGPGGRWRLGDANTLD